jgi:hypothetical protein
LRSSQRGLPNKRLVETIVDFNIFAFNIVASQACSQERLLWPVPVLAVLDIPGCEPSSKLKRLAER